MQAIRKHNYLERRRIHQKIAGSAQVSAHPHLPPPLHPPHGSPSVLDPEARKRKIAALKAQADIEAEKMRQRIAEKQKERKIAAEQDQIKQTHVSSGAGGGGDGGPAVKEEKPQWRREEQHDRLQQKEQHERLQWGAQPVAPIAFAQQPEATGRVTDG